jgi:alpha-L-rhamnosidase
MKKTLVFVLLYVAATITLCAEGWSAKWITVNGSQNATNSWIVFHKNFDVFEIPRNALAKIAVDSKYWLWINGEMVVFEGQLKRGPTPDDTYYDEIDIAPYLVSGENSLAVLQWFFGKDGFSHNCSGKAAFLFECIAPGLNLISDGSWFSVNHVAFGNTGHPHPNYRLSESNIHFDARRGDFGFVEKSFKPQQRNWGRAIVLGDPPMSPWNQLVKRPIPLWKDFGLKDYVETPNFPIISQGDTIYCTLPYNAQITPFFEIEAPAGLTVHMLTDHYFGGSAYNVRAEYVTREGRQSYENLGWMNGHKVMYYFPKGVKVLGLKYRETGYDTEFAGSFFCNDPFYNDLWNKAVRTLYVTMRDTYMDCPDRERAQWWGDVVVESGEAFYALCRKSDHITKKGILELINWQRPDSTIYSPIPSGNYDRELPGQMLASVGYYGFWNYYWNSGDIETIRQVYEGVKKYLAIWELQDNGTVVVRRGGWFWGDWGTNKDMTLLINGWYYLALDGYKRMSALLGHIDEAKNTEIKMQAFKISFNEAFWRGDEYRSDGYEDDTDDRSQALAVVAGLADRDKYDAIYSLLQNKMHASPYMEKYVIEALFMMDQPEYGLERLKLRFGEMVNHPEITTLWESWAIGSAGHGGGSTNHAWSGGGLTILAQYVAGIYPLEAGYKSFQVRPQLGFLEKVNISVPSVKGSIDVSIEANKSSYLLQVTVPKDSKALIHIPNSYKSISEKRKEIFKNGRYIKNPLVGFNGSDDQYIIFEVPEGKYVFNAK